MRIAFVALSGLRACDPELIKLGLNFPGVIERGKQIAQLPTLGLLTLAGLTPQEHEVTYFEVGDLKDLDVLPGPFDLVAISGLSAQIEDGYALAKRFKDAGSQVVMGGLHVTALPQEALQHAHAAVVGEGELIWPTILAHAQARTLHGLYDGKNSAFDLANAPMPAFHLLDMSKYNRLTVQSSRGCPLKCSFCASSITLTSRYKQKPAQRILAEIDRIKELVPRPFIELADDNSFVNRKFWRDLLPHMGDRQIRWFTETDLSIADDEPFLEELAASGCVEVLLGLESPLAARLNGLELNTDWKRKRADKALESVRRIQGKGIRVNGCFIMGLDGQTEDDAQAIMDFVEAAELWDVQLTMLTPFPGTPLYHDLKAQGRLTHDGQWRRCTLFDLNFVPRPMSAETLKSVFRSLVVKLYDQNAIKERRRNFQHVRLRPRARGEVAPALPPHVVPNPLEDALRKLD